MNHRANYKLLGIAALAAATLAVSSPAVRAQNVVAASDTEQECHSTKRPTIEGCHRESAVTSI